MFRKLKDCWNELSVLFVVITILGGLAWYAIRPTTYDFGNKARLVVPFGVFSADMRDKGNGVVVESGANVTVYNDSDEWRALTVSYRKPNYSILDTHAFEDLPPKSSKNFGAETSKYEGMHVSVSDYAQRKRNKSAN